MPLPLILSFSCFLLFHIYLWLCIKHLPISLPLYSHFFTPPFPLSPLYSVLIEGWIEFYILAASDNERPLITVYPRRWYTAVATWDTLVSFYVFFLSPPAFVCASPAFSLHPSRTPPRSQPVDMKPGVYPGLQTCTYCDMPFVKWAVNSGRIALQHPVLWRFVSATIPTKAAVKISPHGKAGVMKQSVCFFVFLLRGKQVTLAFSLPAKSEITAR